MRYDDDGSSPYLQSRHKAEFSFSDTPRDLDQALGEAIGAASVSWHPDGVFDDRFAVSVMKGLKTWIEDHYIQKEAF